jgi:hypothetical protein
VPSIKPLKLPAPLADRSGTISAKPNVALMLEPLLRGRTTERTPAAPRASRSPVFPTAVSPKYLDESSGKARMHTCLDQYNANKATNANGGLTWIARGGGYYSECNKQLKG